MKVNIAKKNCKKRLIHLFVYSLLDTPILGGIRSKEHFLALQRRKNTLIDDDQPIVSNNRNNNTGMQTLGAKNEFVRNIRQRSTLDTKRPSKGPAPNPPPPPPPQLPPSSALISTSNQYGIQNPSFNKNESENDDIDDIDGDGMNVGGHTSSSRAMNLSIYGSNNPTTTTTITNTRNKPPNLRQKNRNNDLNSEL